MAENSEISWTDHTFNPWEGCQKVGPGCDHCYAEARNARFGGGTAPNWGPSAPRRRTSAANWRKPIQWDAASSEFYKTHGRRQRVFCASLADVFDNQIDVAWRRDLFGLIELTPNLDWLLLTKRIGNAFHLVSQARSHDWLLGQRNVSLGITVVNQEEADRDISKLIEMPARKRFLSIEPMLGAIDLREWLWTPTGDFRTSRTTGKRQMKLRRQQGIDWVITGGESGPNARPAHPDWFKSLRDQCAAAGVPYHFKQWGEWLPIEIEIPGDGRRYAVSDDGSERELAGKFPEQHLNGADLARVGKKVAGRLLDGIEHNGFPQSFHK